MCICYYCVDLSLLLCYELIVKANIVDFFHEGYELKTTCLIIERLSKEFYRNIKTLLGFKP